MTETIGTQDTRVGPVRAAGLGLALFTASLVALGITALVRGGTDAVWSGVPKTMPAHTVVPYLCAVVSIASGLGLLWRRTAAIASRLLLAFLAAWMVLFRIPLMVRAPAAPAVWWVCGETAAMIAGAWVLYALLAGEPGGKPSGPATSVIGRFIARVLFGLALISFGVAHFTFLERTAGMVPSWLPWHLGWAYFTGGAFIAAGLASVTGIFARLAAALSAWEMGLFTLLIWVPKVAAGPSASDWDEFVGSCVLTGVAWLVAQSYRDLGWLSVAGPRGRAEKEPLTTLPHRS